MQKCQGLIGLIFGHKFVEMADEEAEYFDLDNDPVLRMQARFDPGSGAHFHGATKYSSRTHVGCVCARCGLAVTAEQQPSPVKFYDPGT
jgi:hypothetical protein